MAVRRHLILRVLFLALALQAGNRKANPVVPGKRAPEQEAPRTCWRDGCDSVRRKSATGDIVTCEAKGHEFEKQLDGGYLEVGAKEPRQKYWW